LVFPVAYILIAGGICACAPLFKRVASALGRLLSMAGFFVGIGVFVVAADTALEIGLFGRLLSPSIADLTASAYPLLRYFLPLMIVLGLTLFSRPLRNIRWASLTSLGVGLLAAYLLNVTISIPAAERTIILGAVFLIATLAVYMLLRFVEDIFDFVGTVLAFPPISLAVGIAAVYFGILIAIAFP